MEGDGANEVYFGVSRGSSLHCCLRHVRLGIISLAIVLVSRGPEHVLTYLARLVIETVYVNLHYTAAVVEDRVRCFSALYQCSQANTA
jgi:hypothetical protein